MQTHLKKRAMAPRSVQQSQQKVRWKFPLQRQNFILLAVGVVLIIVGYALMLTAITNDPIEHQQAWNNPLAVTVAPILLVIGYAVVIPLALLYRPKQ